MTRIVPDSEVSTKSTDSKHSAAKACVGLLTLFVATRALLMHDGVRSDPAVLQNHWQYIDVSLLRDDLLASLYYFHAQPPLWNAIAGLVIKASGGEPRIYAPAFYGLGLIFSLVLAASIFEATRTTTRSVIAATLSTGAYVIASSSSFYEAYAFYPMFCSALVGIFILSTAKIAMADDRQATLWRFAAVASLLLLTWTWTLFHPIIIPMYAMWLFIRSRQFSPALGIPVRRREPVVTFAIVAGFALALIPAAKNYSVFGIPSSGSWAGMNFSQTLPETVQHEPVRRLCRFRGNEDYEGPTGASPPADHPVLVRHRKDSGDPNFNYFAYIGLSKTCMVRTLADIKLDPAGFAFSRIVQFLRSNTKRPEDYFITPLNWDQAKSFRDISTIALLPFQVGFNSNTYYAAPLIVLATIIAAWSRAAIRFARSSTMSRFDLLALLWGSLVIYVQLVGHIFNGGEQERMRFTVEPAYLVFCGIAVHALAARVVARRLKRKSLKNALSG